MSFHCKKCDAAWLSWVEPKRTCAHLALTFGCAECLSFVAEKTRWDFFHSNDLKIPTCGGCGATMLCMDHSSMILQFGCPKEDQSGDMYCDEEKGIKDVEVKV